MNAIQFLSQETGIPESRLEYMDGPDSGVGVDYWIRDTETEKEYYVNNDQEHWTYQEGE